MKTFEYSAVNPKGETIIGTQRAEDLMDLDSLLEGQELTLVKGKAISKSGGTAAGKMTRVELISFTTQLSTVISAGVPILEGLEDLAVRMRTPAARQVVEEMVRDLQAGLSLSEAMGKQGKSFPSVYRASIDAGEMSGDLPAVLSRLARYLEWVRAIRATTIQALVYPCILAFAVVGLIAVLITWVIPRITGLFPGGRDSLPKQTQILLGISDFVVGNWMWLVLGGVAFGVAYGFAMRQPHLRQRLSRVALAIPRYGDVSRMIATSKFASTASTLQQAGCDIFRVLSVAGASCGNAYMAARFEAVTSNVRRGATITDSLAAEPLMDPLLIQMTSVGERSGDLATSLERLAEYYDNEVPRVVKWFLSLLEPLILIVGGVVVAFVLVAALLPIFSMYESMG